MTNGREGRGDQLELAPRIGLSEPLLRPEDAAELLSVKMSWIYEACRTGRLPSSAWGSICASPARTWSLARRPAWRSSLAADRAQLTRDPGDSGLESDTVGSAMGGAPNVS
jgi:hypothetical protein